MVSNLITSITDTELRGKNLYETNSTVKLVMVRTDWDKNDQALRNSFIERVGKKENRNQKIQKWN